MPYLLDTSTCIDALRNHPLYTGVEKCASPTAERAKVDLLLKTLREISLDSAAAREASRIRALLEKQGQMIGPYDVLLAGHALAARYTLVTANTGEFQRVPGLSTEDWRLSK